MLVARLVTTMSQTNTDAPRVSAVLVRKAKSAVLDLTGASSDDGSNDEIPVPLVAKRGFT